MVQSRDMSVVALAEKVGRPMDKLSFEELRGVDKRFEKNVMEIILAVASPSYVATCFSVRDY